MAQLKVSCCRLECYLEASQDTFPEKAEYLLHKLLLHMALVLQGRQYIGPQNRNFQVP